MRPWALRVSGGGEKMRGPPRWGARANAVEFFCARGAGPFFFGKEKRALFFKAKDTAFNVYFAGKGQGARVISNMVFVFYGPGRRGRAQP